MSRFKLAAAQYPVDRLERWEDYRAKLQRWVAEAAEAGARLLVFPEYASMELASLFGDEVAASLSAQLQALQTVLADYRQLHAELARRYGVYLLAGSFPVRDEDGLYRNRAYLYGPDGGEEFQDKLIMTRFENEQWGISAGRKLKVFDTALGRLGVCICYDSEFPLLARAQVEAGADLILVPSCTDTDAGYHRVRLSAQARALENQCYAVQSPLVGEAPWSAAVDVNLGAAAVYTPVDYGFPANGVLAQGERDRPQWVYAEVDLARARELRGSGQVLNFRDWPRQAAPVGGGVSLRSLRGG